MGLARALTFGGALLLAAYAGVGAALLTAIGVGLLARLESPVA
jgi:hypothetical protein